MIIVVDTTYLDFDKVNSILITYEEGKPARNNTYWWNPFSWGTPDTPGSEETYTLTMSYDRGNTTWTYTTKNRDHQSLVDKFKKIIGQLKTQVDVQNQEMLDKLFEEAISNGGSK